MTRDPWLWAATSSLGDTMRLRSQIRRIVCEVDIPISCIIDIYSEVVDSFEVSSTDLAVLEAKCHAMLSILPTPTPSASNDGGINCVAVGLFHYHPKVRRLVLNILSTFEKFSSTNYLLRCLNKMYYIAYHKGLKQLNDGSLQVDEDAEVQNDIKIAKRAAEREREYNERRLAREAKLREEQEELARTDEFSSKFIEDQVSTYIEPIGEVVSLGVNGINSGIQALFQGIDDTTQQQKPEDDPAHE